MALSIFTITALQVQTCHSYQGLAGKRVLLWRCFLRSFIRAFIVFNRFVSWYAYTHTWKKLYAPFGTLALLLPTNISHAIFPHAHAQTELWVLHRAQSEHGHVVCAAPRLADVCSCTFHCSSTELECSIFILLHFYFFNFRILILKLCTGSVVFFLAKNY